MIGGEQVAPNSEALFGDRGNGMVVSGIILWVTGRWEDKKRSEFKVFLYTRRTTFLELCHTW
jgi:hypothetical protein